jgi:hypothetical protein
VEAAGIEPEDAISQSMADKQLTNSAAEMSALCLHGEVNSWQSMASLDPLLARVVQLWPSLPADVRKTIYATCVDAVLRASPTRDRAGKQSNLVSWGDNGLPVFVTDRQ